MSTLSLMAHSLIIPDKHRGWQFNAVRLGSDLIRRCEPAFIFSTGPSHTAHFVAERLHHRWKIPWYLDLQDGWNIDPEHRLKHPRWFNQLIDKRVEQMFSKSRKIFVLTPGLREMFAQRFPQHEKKLYLTIQGVEHRNAQLRPKGKHLVIAYTGSLFAPSYTPEIFLEGVSLFLAQLPEAREYLRIRFYGRVNLARSIAEKLLLTRVVETTGPLPQNELFQKMADADAFLTILNDTAWNLNRIGTKVYDYLSFRKPILALVPPTSDAAWLLRKTTLGRIILPYSAQGVRDALFVLYDDWDSNQLEAGVALPETLRDSHCYQKMFSTIIADLKS